MKIDFFHWHSLGGWTVFVDNEVIGSIHRNTWGLFCFYPRIRIDNNFPQMQCVEIQKSIADFITIQRVTERLTS